MDDIETIEKYGRDETYIFLADSAKRDTAAYPTAAEYEVLFNAQFRNVTKFELLEVNIPRTDYLIDDSENTFAYAINQPTNINTWQQEIEGNIRIATITPGDYNLPQLIDEMNNVLQQTANTYGDSVILQVGPVTNPSEISNKIRITSSSPFTLLGSTGTIGNTIGFGDPVNTSVVSTTGYYSTVPGYSVNYPNGADYVFLSNQGAIGNEYINEFVGPLPPGDNVSFTSIYTGQIPSQYFIATSAGVPTTISAYFVDQATAPAGGFVVNYSIIKVSDSSIIATGSLISTDDDLTPSVSSPTVVNANFIQGEQYYIQFTPGNSGSSAANCTALWYAYPNLPPVSGAYAAINGSSVFPGQYFCTDVTAGAYGNEMTSPGIVNITGARYIKIRCKELEQLIYRDRIGEPTTAGVGIVNLIGYGFERSRYDFSSIPVKAFHPIGKLQKLTFRLERPNGTLYETNGVDNTMLCALTFKVVPNNAVDKTFDGPGKYPAAPGYSGDYIQLQQKRWGEEARATYQTHKATYNLCRPRTT
ncbi:hypothetical protein PBCVNY2B_727R [Paramecium bursaria Chlorella virus NY2B]|uniref:Uncharacterized protein B705R n=1 Tax=Paramecium bursaria Chlorella virus NY2A TaxID=46021 RepID=A7IXN0_PBCVN|nr:hypothetical protein NY2A_B705R [Paramecium bursaria Chlorella virus NY2A]ABT15104.1 hypothetical protein NY2A_B705R [Paramecium bursaria Chlorella virus NY2A]AGE58482.1 hypothetical protein PBCVNY2B_727R [Paramecium bursaria Chlorella virus NY2B]